jgi:hypothetical protein
MVQKEADAPERPSRRVARGDAPQDEGGSELQKRNCQAGLGRMLQRTKATPSSRAAKRRGDPGDHEARLTFPRRRSRLGVSHNPQAFSGWTIFVFSSSRRSFVPVRTDSEQSRSVCQEKLSSFQNPSRRTGTRRCRNPCLRTQALWSKPNQLDPVRPFADSRAAPKIGELCAPVAGRRSFCRPDFGSIAPATSLT